MRGRKDVSSVINNVRQGLEKKEIRSSLANILFSVSAMYGVRDEHHWKEGTEYGMAVCTSAPYVRLPR